MHKSFKYLVLFLVIYLTTSCKSRSKNGSVQVFDGSFDNADPVFKSIVGIGFRQNGTNRVNLGCTGTLVKQNWILTAGHCDGRHLQFIGKIDLTHVFFESNLQESYETDGEGKILDKLGQKVPNSARVIDFLVHPEYDPQNQKSDLDIALIKFEGPIPAGYQTFELQSPPSASQNCLEGVTQNLTQSLLEKCSKVFHYGLGLNSKGKPGILSKDHAFWILEKNGQDVNTVISVNLDKPVVCHGDSGGPVIHFIDKTPFLIGIHRDTSHNCEIEPGKTAYNAFSTSTFGSMEWIKEQIK
jgi:hypothetical protein